MESKFKFKEALIIGILLSVIFLFLGSRNALILLDFRDRRLRHLAVCKAA